MKQVILDGYLVNPGDISWAPLEQLGELTCYDTSPKELIVERLAGAQAAYVNRTQLTRAELEACPELRYIGCLATGFNNVDTQCAKELGITVANVPAYSTYAVAQCTFGLLLEIVQRTSEFSSYVKTGTWTSYVDQNVMGKPIIELYGKTLGIVGMGGIGKVVADIAIAMGMQVLAYRRNPDKSMESDKLRFVSLEELLAQSDVISLHCPLNEGTKNLINEQTIARMKDGAILLNTARGAVVDEAALSAALDSGKLYYAGVDVLTQEPCGDASPLVHNPRCIITPHIAWAPRETRMRLVERVAANAKAFLDGAPTNVVNR